MYKVIIDNLEYFVEVSDEIIERGGWYLYLKNNKSYSIELCDSVSLSYVINKKYKNKKIVFKKITKCNRVLKDPWGYYLNLNPPVILDTDFYKNK